MNKRANKKALWANLFTFERLSEEASCPICHKLDALPIKSAEHKALLKTHPRCSKCEVLVGPGHAIVGYEIRGGQVVCDPCTELRHPTPEEIEAAWEGLGRYYREHYRESSPCALKNLFDGLATGVRHGTVAKVDDPGNIPPEPCQIGQIGADVSNSSHS